jgi:thiol:disulfide interchange protein DsbD
MPIIILFTVFLHSIVFSQTKAKAEVLFFPNEERTPLGLFVTLEKDWHLYWLNSGDSGIPTEIRLSSIAQTDFAEIIWPIPKAFESEGMVSYGYDKNVLLLFDISPDDFAKLKNDDIICEVKSLICKDVCIPFDTTIRFRISEIRRVENLNELTSSHKIKFPEINHSFNVIAQLDEDNDKVILTLSQFDEQSELNSISFYPFENGIFRNVMNNNFRFHNDSYIIKLVFDQFKTHIPDRLEGLLILRLNMNNIVEEKAYNFSVEIKKGNT